MQQSVMVPLMVRHLLANWEDTLLTEVDRNEKLKIPKYAAFEEEIKYKINVLIYK